MRVPYVSNSRFLPIIAAALDDQMNGACAGALIVDLGRGGYTGTVTVDLDPDDLRTFSSNWKGVDVTRFPVRIRAAATALRDRHVFGKFVIVHSDGELRIMSLVS
jgi:hypothetical protein